MLYKTNNLNIAIRKATLEDIDEIYKIEPTIFGKTHWSRYTFENELKSYYSNYFIAEINNLNNKVIGYSGFWKVLNEGHITTLAILDIYRGNHIADILLYYLIKNAMRNNILYLTLEVRISNYIAINLYNKFKFKSLGIRKNYYQDNNEDALVLWTDNIKDQAYIKYIESIISPFINIDGHADKYQYTSR